MIDTHDAIHVTGGLIRKDGCVSCLYDKETGFLVDPCDLHKPSKAKTRRVKDVSLDLPLEIKK